MMGGVLDHHLGFERLQEKPYFPPVAEDPSWIIKNSDRFQPIQMPSTIGDHWQHKKLEWNLAEMEIFLPDLKIRNDALIPHRSNIYPNLPFLTVINRVKKSSNELIHWVVTFYL